MILLQERSSSGTCFGTYSFMVGHEWRKNFVLTKMQGLSPNERAGCTKLLQSLQKSDLLSLCDTVTNKLIAVENDEGKCTVTSGLVKVAIMTFLFPLVDDEFRCGIRN